MVNSGQRLIHKINLKCNKRCTCFLLNDRTLQTCPKVLENFASGVIVHSLLWLFDILQSLECRTLVQQWLTDTVLGAGYQVLSKILNFLYTS